MVNIGELKDKIDIYSIENEIDSSTGINIEVENLKFSGLRAKYQPVNGKEFYKNASDNKELYSKFLTFKRDISEDDIVIFNGKKFNVKFIEPIENNYIRIFATYREV